MVMAKGIWRKGRGLGNEEFKYWSFVFTVAGVACEGC
jgi:hypothetical protein